jgi:hypothetical protein
MKKLLIVPALLTATLLLVWCGDQNEETTTNQISNETIPTIPKYPTTIIVTTNKPTETIYKDTSLILLGFSHYNKFD